MSDGDQEPEDAEAAVAYWRRRWADTATTLGDSAGVIQDLTTHANPIARDDDGFVAVGYTVTVGAVHRALAWLVGASGAPLPYPHAGHGTCPDCSRCRDCGGQHGITCPSR